MPTARWGLCTSVVDGKIYAIGGGHIIYGVTYLSTLEVYDPVTDTWTKKADMPSGRACAAASVVNGKIYVIGGSPRAETDTTTVEEYDPATDTWTRKADMPTMRSFLSTSVVDGKIYAIGGHSNVRSVEVYDPATDTWTKKADMPTARAGLSTSAVNGKIYAIGGVVVGLGGSGISTVEVYEPATDTWTTKTRMPTPRKCLSTSVVDGKIYAIGGGTGMATVFSAVEVYDPATNRWTRKADMPTARELLSTSAVDGRIYAIGGDVVCWPWTPTATVEVYDPNPLVVDFNGDEIVDIDDLLILMEHWGQDDPMCDIAPRPFGDGVVDVLDLELLMSYWGQEIPDPASLAHWKLDETEGDIAYDSVAVNDAVVFGDVVWQPTAGAVDGALAFDGTDGYVSTPFVLNPADGEFSVFAWIKGGAPGQVVISQTDGAGMGATWLSADPTDGKLMTKLMPPAIGLRVPPQPLVSEFVITDGDWHRIGFVWDGSQRMLYIDDVEVGVPARISKPGLSSPA